MMGRSGFVSHFTVVSALVMALLATVAYGDVFVDQACDDLNLEASTIGAYNTSESSWRSLAQTFKPSANNIVGVDLYVSRTSTFTDVCDVTIAIYSAPDHEPTGSIITSITLKSDQILEGYQWQHFDLPEASLTPDQRYAIVISVDEMHSGGSIGMRFAKKDAAPYNPGQVMFNKDGAGWVSNWCDAYFKTYAVPEPGTLALLTIGTGAAAIRRRR